jgi:16S rRNA (guanine527-N7)-methyltransferase
MTTIASAQEFGEAFSVSRETLEILSTYDMLLHKWNPRINLVSPSTLPDLWHRHFTDSAQLLALAPEGARSWVDLGSGGGLPGLVIAILARERRPDLAVTLVESDQRKAVFLRHAATETATPCRILARRVETVPPEIFDIVSARALAPLDKLLDLAAPLIAPGGLGLFPKGAAHECELTAARRHWHIGVRAIPSLTDPESRILLVKEVQRVT